MSHTTTPPSHVQAESGRRILAVVDDLFFLAKIQETARWLGVKLQIARNPAEVEAELAQSAPPNLVIVDLNARQCPALEIIGAIDRHPARKKISLIGFVSHLQAELKQSAQAAGCDRVMPRSAFSLQLPALLRRYGLPDPA